MRRIADCVILLAKGILFLGFSLQIVLGAAWIAANFAKDSFFRNDSGLLYAGLLKAAEGMGRGVRIPFFCLLYLLQILALGYAVWLFLGTWEALKGKKALKIWGTAAVLSNAMIVQCMVAPLPNAFLAACILALFILGIRFFQEGAAGWKGKVLFAALVWIAAGLMAREYFFMGAVLLFLFGILLHRKKMFSFPGGRLAFFAAAALICVLGNMVYVGAQKAGFYEEKMDLKQSLFSRFAWNTLLYKVEDAPEEIRAVLTEDEIRKAGYYADTLFLETMPLVEERLGREEAGRFYLAVSKRAWQQAKGTILHDILWDLGGYVVPPVVFSMHMRGMGFRSLSIRNYEFMGRYSPVLTKYYVNYSTCWFVVSFFLAFAVMAAKRIRGGENGKNKAKIVVFGSVMVFMQAICYTFQGAGLMDYKKAVFSLVLWGGWMVYESLGVEVW